MIGLNVNPANPGPNDLVVTELSVILPGSPSTNQLEFGIPVIRDVTLDRLCLESALRGSRSPGILSDLEHGKPQSSPGMVAFCGETNKATQEESTDRVLVPNSVGQAHPPIQRANCNMRVTDVAIVAKGKAATVGPSAATSSDDTEHYTINCEKTCTGTNPKASVGNSDTATGLPHYIEKFIKAAARPVQNPSAVSQEIYNAQFQDKPHSTTPKSDGPEQCTRSCNGTATTESGDRMAEDDIDGASAGFPCASKYNVGLTQVTSRSVQSPTGVSQDCADTIPDDSCSASDSLPDSSSQTQPAVPLGEEGMTLNPTEPEKSYSENASSNTQSKQMNNKPRMVQTVSTKHQEPSTGTDWNVRSNSPILYQNPWTEIFGKT